ncbi:hypothetical protein E2562_018240 [Oryza meyeriana var. granulata]|uniref:Uncharacterized protein n=1 Tax=Oryza meyeriana var. granulata TaxID=110450 RepID=A0A6G1CGR6_9ORYZ|nr:hypothetical protein E2562_018240 [Oryza meyeriana var. granulata]
MSLPVSPCSSPLQQFVVASGTLPWIGNCLAKQSLAEPVEAKRHKRKVKLSFSEIQTQVSHMVVKPLTWGKKPHSNFGHCRPRPICAVYPKGATYVSMA